MKIVSVYADQSVSVTIPEQFRDTLGQGRTTMRFQPETLESFLSRKAKHIEEKKLSQKKIDGLKQWRAIDVASRFFEKLERRENRAKLNDRYGQAKLGANLMPVHMPQGKTRLENSTKHYRTWGLK